VARNPLWQEVEVDGHTFWLGAADEAMARFANLDRDRDGEGEYVAAMCAYFVEAVRGWLWEGVEFTPANVRDIPVNTKVAVVLASFGLSEAMLPKESPSESPPTTSTPIL
jgi:hypothetical protein